ncbi:Biotin protein ligase C-terminal domain-containing protein [Entamoeba marina]
MSQTSTDKYLGNIVKVILEDDRAVVGVLECIDKRGNICLRDPYECRILPSPIEGMTTIKDVVKMRNVVIPTGHWKKIYMNKSGEETEN